MKLRDYYEKSGLTYPEIVAKANLQIDQTQVFHCVNNPGRVGTFDTFLSVARALGMSDDEARKEWSKARIDAYRKRTQVEAGIDVK